MSTSPLTDKDAISPLADVEAMCARLADAKLKDAFFTANLNRHPVLDEAAAMLRSLSKDAKRYRWLRICLDRDVRVLLTDRLDAAIDAALAAKE